MRNVPGWYLSDPSSMKLFPKAYDSESTTLNENRIVHEMEGGLRRVYDQGTDRLHIYTFRDLSQDQWEEFRQMDREIRGRSFVFVPDTATPDVTIKAWRSRISPQEHRIRIGEELKSAYSCTIEITEEPAPVMIRD